MKSIKVKRYKIQNSKKTSCWRIIQRWVNILFGSCDYHTLPTPSKRYIQQIIYLFFDFVKTILLMHILARFFVRNFERPMTRSNLFVRDTIATQHIS
jgi:hypothetical protein